MTTKPRILVVEDESAIADTVQYALQSDGFEATVCATAGQALQDFSAAVPALVILDVGLPDMSGFELFHRLRAIPGAQDVPILFLTARSAEVDRVVGLELGADDYVAKPFSPRELVARVRVILRRAARGGNGEAASPQAAPQSTQPFAHDATRMQIRYYGHPLELTRYEYRLLALLLQRPGRVFTRDELLDLVWDDGSESMDRTVDAHIKTLRARLRAVAPQVDPIRTLRGTGYALREDLPPQPQQAPRAGEHPS